MPRGFLIGCVLGLFLGGGLALLVGGDAVAPDRGDQRGELAAETSTAIDSQPIELPRIRPEAVQPEEVREPLREELSAGQGVASPSYQDLPDSWLAGRVVDASGQGIANVIVRAEMARAEAGSGGRPADSGYAPLSVAGRSSATGRFVLRGLLAGAEYRIGARSQGRPRISAGSGRARDFLKRTVITPQDNLVLTLSETGLLLVFIPSPDLEDRLDRWRRLRLSISVHSEDGRWTSSGGSFPLEFKVELVPGKKVSLNISGELIRDVTFKDLVLKAGEGMRRLEIDLESALGSHLVVLQVNDELGNHIEAVHIRRIKDDFERDIFLPGRGHFRGPLHGERGRFQVSDLLGGEQTLRIDAIEGSGLVSALVEIVVPEVGEVFRSVTLVRGGRLRLRLANGQEKIGFGRVELRVDGEWRGQSMRLRRLGASGRGSIRKLEPGQSYETSWVLPSGTYGLRLHLDGEGSIEREFTIIPGQVTKITLSVN